MCTVTFIPTSDGFYLTSSRDERASRHTLPPKKYDIDREHLIFPKDEHAGGTWIAASAAGKCVCLLNGAFEKHEHKPPYKKSRGIIVLDTFNYQSILEFEKKEDLDGVEPFTIVYLNFHNEKIAEFYELRWDGLNKHLKKLNTNTCQIWSSASLYSPSIRLTREELFKNWIEKHADFEDRMIFNFHNQKHGLQSAFDIIMEGQMDLKTVSISQIHIGKTSSNFRYLDRSSNKEFKVQLVNEDYRNV